MEEEEAEEEEEEEEEDDFCACQWYRWSLSRLRHLVPIFFKYRELGLGSAIELLHSFLQRRRRSVASAKLEQDTIVQHRRSAEGIQPRRKNLNTKWTSTRLSLLSLLDTDIIQMQEFRGGLPQQGATRCLCKFKLFSEGIHNFENYSEARTYCKTHTHPRPHKHKHTHAYSK